MQPSNQLAIDITQGSVFPLVLGKNKTTDFKIKNNSNSDKAYNASIIITLGDSLQLLQSSIQATNVVELENFSKKYTFLNIKDFAPNEINYNMSFDTKSNENYKSGNPVAFNAKVQSNITITWDSMPRGSYDVGNIQYYNSINFEFLITRLSIKKTIPQKRVKGAGTDTILPSKIFENIIEVENNTRENTTFNLTDILPDSIRYLGNITIISPITNPLPTPQIQIDEQTAQKTILRNNCTFVNGEFLKFKYNAAIWEKFSLDGIENEGLRINHGTSLQTTITAKNNEFDINYSRNIVAMDAIINLSDNKTTVDVEDVINYYINIEVNQYYNIKNVVATFFTLDGQEPLNTTGGTVLQELANHTIPVEYTNANINANAFHNINLTTTVVSQYREDLQYISCGDIFNVNANLSANNFYDQAIQDNSTCSQSIIIPIISKKITNIYYRDLTLKNINSAVAPLDFIEYELSFDSSFIKASKKNILLDDFFPLESRLPNIEDIEQISGTQVEPVLISPHGLRFNLSNVTDQTPWKIRLKSQVGTSVTQSKLNNLFKLTGSTNINTSYSDRKQVSTNTGKPNIVVTRIYDGFTPANVYGGVEYTCGLKISNLQNSEGTATDAFAFQIAEQTYSGITVVPNSWSITGQGLYIQPQGGSNFITSQILRLYVGQELTLNYKVILPLKIQPGFSGNIASQIGVPYTQIVDSMLENVLYSFIPPVSNVQLRTKNLTISKTYSNAVLQIGSQVNYTLQYTVPRGTAIFNASLVDELPVGQVLTGEVYLNGNPITVTVSNQNIIFPEILEINPTESDISYVYTFQALINDANIVFPTTTQTNRCVLNYKNYLNASFSRNATRNVIISHPLMSISLSPLNGTILDNKTSFNVRATIENKSTVGARDCIVNLPIPQKANYISGYSQTGTVLYNNSTLTWNIGNLLGQQSATLNFSFKGKNDIFVLDTISFLATLLEYKNNISNTKIYPSVESNILTYNCIPNVNVSVYPANRSLSGSGHFQFTSNTIVYAPYSVINLSGGIDSFSLKISPIKWPYDLFIENQFIDSVSASTQYNGTPALLSNIKSGNKKDIMLKIYIPTLTQVEYDRFTITTTSLADENYYSSVETSLIDP